MQQLIKKYNKTTPRYTSYPTMPFWKTELFTVEGYKNSISEYFSEQNKEGIALYIHLPYCESLCTYCGCNTRITVNHKVEEPYIDALLKEWEMYLEIFGETPKIKEIHLGGGTPTFFSPENLRKLISGLISKAIVFDNPKFSFEGHPGNTTKEHLEVLHKLGFQRLSLGIQDYEEKVQIAINRKQTAEQVDTIVKQARAIGYESVNFDIVYGLPFQTLGSTINTIQEVIKQKPERIAYYSYAHVPWKKPGQRAYDEKDLPPADEKLEMFIKGREMLLEAGYEAIGMDHFALPSDSMAIASREGALHRNFMGYTDQKTSFLLGLGVSSISDTNHAYAQNVKTVEGYIEKVNKGDLPVFKGHFISLDDYFVRKHILNLICRYETSWENAPGWEKFYMKKFLHQLESLAEDGLVCYHENGITVTKLGKTFVRNICAKIDSYLFDEVESNNKFSMAI